MQIDCIANNGANGEPEVPLWMCPCRECTALDYDAAPDEGRAKTLAWHRHINHPEFWDTPHERG